MPGCPSHASLPSYSAAQLRAPPLKTCLPPPLIHPTNPPRPNMSSCIALRFSLGLSHCTPCPAATWCKLLSALITTTQSKEWKASRHGTLGPAVPAFSPCASACRRMLPLLLPLVLCLQLPRLQRLACNVPDLPLQCVGKRPGVGRAAAGWVPQAQRVESGHSRVTRWPL